MKRCDCGCEVWKNDRKPEKDGEAPPAKESRDTRQQKDEVEMKTGRR